MLRLLLVILPSFLACTTFAQPPIAILRVGLPRPTDSIAVPAETSLDDITHLPDSALQLMELAKNGRRQVVRMQIENNDGHRTLHWFADPAADSYRLVKKTRGVTDPYQDPIRAIAKDGDLTISNGDQYLLRYVYKTVYPPAGVDTAYKRSGFIHPLWSPKGQVLTRIQPPDHYHHYGIWDPWTHILFRGDTVDCWNLKDRKGTVRFVRLGSIVSGPVFAQYDTYHEHVAFHKDHTEEVMMNELQTVRVYKPADNSDYYLFDITIRLHCATPNPVRLLAYRYGGLGWRATPDWNKDNSEVLTSEGKTRKDADGSKARWCIVQGAVGGDYAGAAMLSWPGNYNHPEPLRIWPENANGRGDVYANFSPTKDVDWPLYPGHDYVLRYRWIVFNGHFSAEKAEAAWQYYAHPPKVSVTLNHHNT